MSIEVFWGSGSTPAWRVLLALAAKGVPYTGHLLSFSNRETRTPEFLALNPRGKVPVLRDGEFVLNESLAILAYLDERFPEPPLFGVSPKERGQIWRSCLEYVGHGDVAFGVVARPLLFGQSEAQAQAIRDGLPAVYAELDSLNAAVKDGFLVGGRLSAADLVWFCGLHFLQRAATRPAAANFELGLLPFGARWPNLLPWAAHIESLPGYLDTVPPHWLTSDPPSSPRLS